MGLLRRLSWFLPIGALLWSSVGFAAPPAPGTIRADSVIEVDAPASGTNRLDQLTVTGMANYSTEAFVKSLGKYFALVPYTGSPPDGTTLINATDGRQWQVVTGGGGGGSGITQLTGDGTAGPGSGSQAFTLAASGVTAATYGSATAVMVCAIDAKGRATSCSSTTISVPSTAISDSTTLGRQLLTAGSVAAAQGFLSLTPGTNVQAFSANLSAFAGLSLVADRLPYANGTGTLALTTYTSLARTWDAFTTSAQQTAALNTFTSSLPGLVTASGGGGTNVLHADGTWSPAGGTGISALTGDVTASGSGTVTATNVNAPDGFAHAGKIVNTEIAAPGTPAAGKVSTWVDSTDARLHDKNPAGTVGTTVVSDAGAANNFLTGISAAGVPSKAQPAFSNLSGSATAAQMPAFSGDVTTSAGSTVTTLANIPTGAPAVGTILHTNIAAPSSPASGKDAVYSDNTDLRLHDKNASGIVGTTVVSDTGATNNFLTGVTTAGAITKAQPAFSNLSGSATASQMPAFSGDATTSAGSTVVTVANLPTTVTQAGKITATETAAPSTPGAGVVVTWVDSTDARFHDKNPAGATATTVVPSTAGANQFATGVSSAGAVAYTQPAFTNLSGSATTAQLGTNTATNSVLAQMGAGTIKGNNTGSTANAADLTATQVTAMLNLFGTSLQGLAPASGGGTTNYLRADGTWAAPTGGGTVTSVTASSPLASSGGATPNITVTSSTGSGAIVEATSPTITTPTLAGATLSADLAAGNNDLNDVQTVTYDAVFDNGNKTGASPALLTWNAGANQKLTLTGNITGTPTWTLPPKTQYLALDVCQNGTGGFTMAWPAVTWDGGVAPTLLSAANACTRVSLRYDGTTVTGTSGVLYAKTASLGTAAFANGTTLLRVSALTSGTSLTKASGVTMAVAYIYAGGGGGGGCATASSTACAAGGGAAGGRAVWVTSTMPASAWTYAIGAAGTAGTTSGTTGGAGGSSTLSNGTTTVTANGGPGGTTAAPSASAFVRLGGAPPSISTNGTVNGSGDRGDWGGCIASSAGCHSGAGASSDFGAGGNALNAAGAGNAGVGPGAGGSGAISTSTSFAGGVGTAGLIILYEYE